MPNLSDTCAYGGFPLTCHWQFGQSPPIPPSWIQSWTGQVLSEFPPELRPKLLALMARLKGGVQVWSTDRPDKPQYLAERPQVGGWYWSHEKRIYLNSDKAGKAVYTHEIGHFLQDLLVEEFATSFADTFAQIDGVRPAPGARELFLWAVAQGGS